MGNAGAQLDPQEAKRLLHRQYLVPSLFFGAAALCILISIFLPYWEMELEAPQYPKGLYANLYVNRLTGDVREIDGLNHYIGMRPLGEAATLEKSLSIFAIVALALATASVMFVHNKWAALLALPVVMYPIIFLADLFFWLRLFGQNLDPRAALSSSVDPFTPPLIGSKQIANFVVITRVDTGFYLALLAVALVIVGMYFHWRTYKPLVDAAHADQA